MKWLKRVLLVLLALVALLAAVPYFLPLSTYIPIIEGALSQEFKQPVKIGRLKAAGMPLPHLILEEVSVGEPAKVTIAAVKLVPELHSLLDDTKVLRRIELEGGAGDEWVLDAVPRWLAAGTSPAVRVERIKLVNSVLRVKKSFIGPFDADVFLDAGGGLSGARADMADGSLSLTLKPGKQGGYLLDASANNWNPPLQPALHIDAMKLQGRLNTGELLVNRLDARVFGGTAAGNGRLAWRKQWQLAGTLNGQDIEIRQLVALVQPKVAVSGKLKVQAQFTMTSKEAANLFDNPSADADFEVRQGVLRNVDIEKAAKSAGKGGVQGGETRFENFTGKLHVENQMHQLRDLNLDSGMLNASGALNIAPDKKLSGMIQVQLKGSASLVGMPMTVGGTLDSPTLRPTTGTMTGAAVGTLLLGPGMGTSLGMRAGQWIEKLFGTKDVKDNKAAGQAAQPGAKPAK
ncbi:MAG: AsmA family protein [Pseudomonadota bacterium]